MKDAQNFTDEVSKGAGAVQALLAVAGAAGILTLLRSAWARATLAYDEKFLLALARHEQATARADEITKASHVLNEKSDSIAADKLLKLARDLRRQADTSLNYAIAQANWRNCRQRSVTIGLTILSAGVLTFAVMISVLASSAHRPSPTWALILAGISTFGVFFGTCLYPLGRAFWIEREAAGKHDL